jgi:hypothetical protein
MYDKNSTREDGSLYETLRGATMTILHGLTGILVVAGAAYVLSSALSILDLPSATHHEARKSQLEKTIEPENYDYEEILRTPNVIATDAR